MELTINVMNVWHCIKCFIVPTMFPLAVFHHDEWAVSKMSLNDDKLIGTLFEIPPWLLIIFLVIFGFDCYWRFSCLYVMDSVVF